MNRKDLTTTFDFKLKKPLWSPWFIQEFSNVVRAKSYAADLIVYISFI